MELETKTALDILREETQQRSIITMCRKLDDALGSGIAPGLITEFSGSPGAGKTLFCLQLCVTVQIPKSVGGVGGKAIFIDTNQDFSPRRLKEIATSFTKRYEDIFKNLSKDQEDIEFTVDNILSGIAYYYCSDHASLLAVVGNLKQTLECEQDIKLVAIDSIHMIFNTMEDYLQRTRLLYELLTDLQILADKHEIAIVLTNNLTTRLFNNEGYICPALGDSLGHKVGQRILLGRKPNNTSGQFVGYLAKTIRSQPMYFNYKITSGGIRGGH